MSTEFSVMHHACIDIGQDIYSWIYMYNYCYLQSKKSVLFLVYKPEGKFTVCSNIPRIRKTLSGLDLIRAPQKGQFYT